MATLKKQLSRIYKAGQCTDLADVKIALEQVQELVKLFEWTPALRNRVRSLEKRRTVLWQRFNDSENTVEDVEEGDAVWSERYQEYKIVEKISGTMSAYIFTYDDGTDELIHDGTEITFM